jgi:anti-sigma-K factor RskA
MSPGIYTLNAGEKKARFAVNIDPMESRTAPLATDEFERLGVPVAQLEDSKVETRRQAQLQNSELENRQKLWRWILLGTIAVLLMETWLAGRTSRAVAAQGGAA